MFMFPTSLFDIEPFEKETKVGKLLIENRLTRAVSESASTSINLTFGFNSSIFSKIGWMDLQELHQLALNFKITLSFSFKTLSISWSCNLSMNGYLPLKCKKAAISYLKIWMRYSDLNRTCGQ